MSVWGKLAGAAAGWAKSGPIDRQKYGQAVLGVDASISNDELKGHYRA
jgi:hypothetical protein